MKEYLDDYKKFMDKTITFIVNKSINTYRIFKNGFKNIYDYFKIKNNRKKGILFFSTFILVMIIYFGLITSFSYYTDYANGAILNNIVGDFDNGDGDFNIILYATDRNTNKYIKVKNIPNNVLYRFDSNLTTCTKPCINSIENNSECNYNFDSVNERITLNSKYPVTCKFYFVEQADIDLNINLYLKANDGTHIFTHNGESNNYKLIQELDDNYNYLTYYCENDSIVTYDNGNITVNTTKEDICNVYFE